jgi:DNA polymerase IV
MHRVIFHVDMDAFFASVEQRDHPEYRGKPVIVGSPPDRRGVICAASYEARRFGIHSAMPSRTAGKLCPEGIFVRPRMDAYREESRAIMAIFESLTSLVQQVSVDEAYLDLSLACRNQPDQDSALRAALPLARDIKGRIRSERGLSASIGVAANKFLAKLGSDFQKPDGLTLIPEADKIAFLRPLPVRSIHGVGPVTAQQLESAGFRTIGDIQDRHGALEELVGSSSINLKMRAFGEDDRPLELDRERKSISAEHTFAEDTEQRAVLREALREMAADLAGTLSQQNLGALTVQVKVRYGDFHTLTRQLRLEEPVVGAAEIYRLSCHLLAVHKLVNRPLRLLGIGASTLVEPVTAQLRLAFEADKTEG